MPHASLDSFFFWNSGSEAIEASIKIARVATGRQNIISLQGLLYSPSYLATPNRVKVDTMDVHLVQWP